MKTPIYDFVKNYTRLGTSRFHMPGHKGKSLLGPESFDITEICGADTLYDASGIIKESEKNATALFGSYRTVYSTEGSTLAIKAMLKIAYDHKCEGKSNVILAARNVHKSFINACALLGIDIEWIYPKERRHICSCAISIEDVKERLSSMKRHPFAVYLTSPDYLGYIQDVHGISEVCDEFRIPLLVDNAHGAYLGFLDESMHPIALGASMCADSAHKTLPVLTGGAYLHVSNKCRHMANDADSAFSLFASTSPSYLILESLDLCNDYISKDYKTNLRDSIRRIDKLKNELKGRGIPVIDSEPLKIVIGAASIGYSGTELSEHLRSHSVEVEFSDHEYTVLMATPENTEKDFNKLLEALSCISPGEALNIPRITPSSHPIKAMTVREATLSCQEIVSIDSALGRICGSATVSCPPAVPIVVSGEVIGEDEVALFKSYGIDTVRVVKHSPHI